MITELWSIKENRAYIPENAKLTIIKGQSILTSLSGDPLVTRRR